MDQCASLCGQSSVELRPPTADKIKSQCDVLVVMERNRRRAMHGPKCFVGTAIADGAATEVDQLSNSCHVASPPIRRHRILSVVAMHETFSIRIKAEDSLINTSHARTHG